MEYTIPDKPQSRLQKYRLTDKGRQLVAAMRGDKRK
jgi:predicted transcriptional regulator